MTEDCWWATMAAVKVKGRMYSPSGVKKARWQDKDLKGIVSRDLIVSSEKLPQRVKKSMVFEDNLLQMKEHYRKANDRVVPTELLSTQSTPTSLYGFVAPSCTCLIFCRPKIQVLHFFLDIVPHLWCPSSFSFPDLTVPFLTWRRQTAPTVLKTSQKRQIVRNFLKLPVLSASSQN